MRFYFYVRANTVGASVKFRYCDDNLVIKHTSISSGRCPMEHCERPVRVCDEGQYSWKAGLQAEDNKNNGRTLCRVEFEDGGRMLY